jgi:CBS domain-containing protein
MKAKDIMTPDPRTLRPDDFLALAGQIMAWTGTRHIPVVSEDRFVGLLTERDLIVHRAKAGGSVQGEKVERIMRKHVHTAHPEDSVSEIAGRMAEERLGCFPVVACGHLVGLITSTDVLRHHVREAMQPPASPLSDRTVADIMNGQPEYVFADTHLLDAAGRMQQRRLRHLPVVDGDERVIAVLSDRDVRAAIGDPAHAFERNSPALELLCVRDAMSTPAVTTTPERSCSEVARDFVTLSVSAMPFTDDVGKLLGLLSYVDVLRALVEDSQVQRSDRVTGSDHRQT